ncbi:MAG: hypothetical protein QOJ88_395 [Pyrinomonadaceae bacterium]|jgi:hypothetical protein|nr:hypothetical protein [Pyrinomonadaceae bacterium]
MTKRIPAIALIFVCASVAWAILGATIFSRTYSLDEIGENRVASTWGAPQNQAPPLASFKEVVSRKEEGTENGKKLVKTIQEEITTPLPLESSAVDVSLDLEHRQKGLLWFSTYKVGFAGDYAFRNTSTKEQDVSFVLHFPATRAIYDDLVFTVNGSPVGLSNQENAATGQVKVAAGEVAHLTVGYRSQGLNEWRYSFGSNDVSQVRAFSLRIKTTLRTLIFPRTRSHLRTSLKRTTVGTSDGTIRTWCRVIRSRW